MERVKHCKIKNTTISLDKHFIKRLLIVNNLINLKISFFIILVPFFLVSKNIFGSQITIKEFIELAEKNDPQLHNILKDNEKLLYIMDQGLPNRKINLSVEHERGFTISSGINTNETIGEISKEFIESGTTVSVSHSSTVQPNQNGSVSQVLIEQSLLKNFFGRDTRLKKSALKDEEEVVRLQVLEDYEEYIFTLLSHYLDYQKAFLDLELAKAATNESVRLNSNVAKKFNKKIATQTDFDKSKLQLIIRKEDLLAKQREMLTKWETIKPIVGGPVQRFPDQGVFQSLYKYVQKQRTKDTKFDSLRTIIIYDKQKQSLSKDAIIAERQVSPSLDFFGGYKIDESRRFATTVNQSEILVGLKLEAPFWDSQTKANSLEVKLNQTKADLSLKIKKKDLKIEIKRLDDKIEELSKKRTLLKEKVKVSSRIVKDERKRYNYGRIDLDDLLESETNFTRYRFEEQSEELEYNKALLEWLSKNDKLLDFKETL